MENGINLAENQNLQFYSNNECVREFTRLFYNYNKPGYLIQNNQIVDDFISTLPNSLSRVGAQMTEDGLFVFTAREMRLILNTLQIVLQDVNITKFVIQNSAAFNLPMARMNLTPLEHLEQI